MRNERNCEKDKGEGDGVYLDLSPCPLYFFFPQEKKRLIMGMKSRNCSGLRHEYSQEKIGFYPSLIGVVKDPRDLFIDMVPIGLKTELALKHNTG